MSWPKLLMIIGVVIFIVGLSAQIIPSNYWSFLGKLPGDIKYESENVRFYFPITTSIVLSIVLSLIFYLFSKF